MWFKIYGYPILNGYGFFFISNENSGYGHRQEMSSGSWVGHVLAPMRGEEEKESARH